MADKFQLKALITGVDKLSPMLKGVQKNASVMRKHLESSGLGKISLGDLAGGGAFAMPFVAGVQAAIAFESKMADVKKVMSFDEGQEAAQFAAMNKDVLALSRDLPMAAEGIASIYAAGGQSGIARGELKAFATDAIKMGVAFDQTADESGKMMATWRTSFKMGQDDVVALADKINYLGNTGPATTKQISGIVTKIGPLGEVAGMASGQIAAMGATLAGVGVEEDVAATGMKNFMLALTAGTAATKAQSETFKALRMDSKQVAAGMQKDSEGTIMKVLQAVSKVDKSKQAAVLSQLFGKESIGAIAPMLTNLDLLAGNFKKVADEQTYAGSMAKEYASRAATTENNLQLLKNRTVELGIAMGTAFLPAINDGVGALGPLISKVADFAAANPWFIKGLLGAAVGFVGLRLAVMGGVAALKLMSAVTAMSPMGIFVRALALGAGMLIANWSAVGPFFEGFWNFVQPLFELGWIVLKEVFAWSPMGWVIKNWEPIVDWFSKMWDRIKPYVGWIGDAAKWVRGNAVEVVNSYKGGQATAPAAAATSPVKPATSPLSAAAAAQKQQLQGEMVVRFENAPPGLKMESATSNQPGVDITSKNFGYRSLSGAY
ncbi:phage tail tape measure protein [Comamonas aquatica]|jgi:TP901 family phage tail tape measure protein|uniref:phage tail tape measure protein n=1 Tax=Comamonas aquatica TaxID=225991 RepID=UPI00244C26C4|nr:phage tail tape measure protein [Comamonas aquatica]MDH0897794.1 phage tail tape measure protein [Comamonas aquatica]